MDEIIKEIEFLRKKKENGKRYCLRKIRNGIKIVAAMERIWEKIMRERLK
jgi:hypothetical protein